MAAVAQRRHCRAVNATSRLYLSYLTSVNYQAASTFGSELAVKVPHLWWEVLGPAPTPTRCVTIAGTLSSSLDASANAVPNLLLVSTASKNGSVSEERTRRSRDARE